ncbi:UDP-N-acetylmuramoylalanine--D-glutamate ligase [Chitinophaga terrae (ex Kim and Jung 2007)]|jgi:UDP-N-acetylmuramoylalanine--D-glutamate ligase|uniref:UDP-N-acetylmuramoylalanine--D-glutamate ligase n=1 Tax=Chitinophaga terrae (ex Kim and Jung 2007) TaxID=408074 RepID=A0A1H4DLB4_9BACT|nr:UDP-N-acetylmuramoyl-L-alanine--D-glutamate ligase [Chitinophaga terrae (ex Kim and Jung 2007)]GEP90984.1 UDP-N-acetylmuramoylalanine--D-glutamate ligase [Chitinophaga terrae (ex Kim and Jung 2007)]SEA73613.1 UDP-N-acetylmuramoylalanine--D-glutamate ligase [Chitinophaga terrae (ex Kim and Jung 2007)]
MSHKLIILGAGESGIGAALLGKKQGYDVFVSDGGTIKDNYKQELAVNQISFEEGHHSWDKVLGADEIVKSPGIPEKSDLMKKVREAGVPVISEIELAYRFSTGKKIIAITGSNGKSTTTALTYHIFKNAGLDVAMVGNIGVSWARQVATEPAEYYVIEISSFQLDDIKTFKPNVAILLNITPDHLDRYDYKMENYVASKFRIAMNQTAEDAFVYCMDDPEIMQHLAKQPIYSASIPFTIMKPLKEGGFVDKDQLHIDVNGEPVIMSMYDLSLKGKHNLYNSMAAAIAARTMDIRKEKIRESLTSFESLEHRMEYVATVKGVDFINDSKATNVNSVWFALESFEKPIVLIMGGIDKGNDYSAIRDLVKEKVKAIICMGVDNTPIINALSKDTPVMISTASMHDAVTEAFNQATKGDIVLLSPACASFDLFKNYEDRGRKFKEEVKGL